MTRWTDTTAARFLAGLTYTPRHRASSVRVDEALTLAEMDASDRMTIVEAAS